MGNSGHNWLLRRRATIQCQRAISRSYLALESAPNYWRENAVGSPRRCSPGTYFPFAKASGGTRKMRDGSRSDEDTAGTITGGTGHSRKVRRIESGFTTEKIRARERTRSDTRGKGSTKRTRDRRWEKTTCINDMMDGGRGLCLRYLYRNARKRERAREERAYPFNAHATRDDTGIRWYKVDKVSAWKLEQFIIQRWSMQSGGGD